MSSLQDTFAANERRELVRELAVGVFARLYEKWISEPVDSRRPMLDLWNEARSTADTIEAHEHNRREELERKLWR